MPFRLDCQFCSLQKKLCQVWGNVCTFVFFVNPRFSTLTNMTPLDSIPCHVHTTFMKEAYQEALTAKERGEAPIGAVVVCQNRIIARAHNLTEMLQDPTAHAEMQAITSATHFLGGKYLPNCTMYVTLEPCVMCAGALRWAQLGVLVYAASDPKQGFMRIGSHLLHPKTEIISGVLEAPCSEMLTRFFAKKR